MRPYRGSSPTASQRPAAQCFQEPKMCTNCPGKEAPKVLPLMQRCPASLTGTEVPFRASQDSDLACRGHMPGFKPGQHKLSCRGPQRWEPNGWSVPCHGWTEPCAQREMEPFGSWAHVFCNRHRDTYYPDGKAFVWTWQSVTDGFGRRAWDSLLALTRSWFHP